MLADGSQGPLTDAEAQKGTPGTEGVVLVEQGAEVTPAPEEVPPPEKNPPMAEEPLPPEAPPPVEPEKSKDPAPGESDGEGDVEEPGDGEEPGGDEGPGDGDDPAGDDEPADEDAEEDPGAPGENAPGDDNAAGGDGAGPGQADWDAGRRTYAGKPAWQARARIRPARRFGRAGARGPDSTLVRGRWGSSQIRKPRGRLADDVSSNDGKGKVIDGGGAGEPPRRS